MADIRSEILLGYEVGTGNPVKVPLLNLAVTGQTQESGKTTTLEALADRSGAKVLTFVAFYAEFKRRLIEDGDPAVIRLLQSRPEIEVKVERKTVEIDATSLKGRIAKLIAGGFFDEGKTQSGCRSELKRTGSDVNQGNLWKTLAALVSDGFLTLEPGKEYRAVGGMKINGNYILYSP